MCQGQIIAVWILAAKLPNSDLNFAVDFWVDFSTCCFPREKAQKIHQKISCKFHLGPCPENSPRIYAPSDLCRSLVSTHVENIAWWTFRIFFIFFSSGEGKEKHEVPESGGVCVLFFIKIPKGGSRKRAGAVEVCAGEFFLLVGGGPNFFFVLGPKCAPSSGIGSSCHDTRYKDLVNDFFVRVESVEGALGALG